MSSAVASSMRGASHRAILAHYDLGNPFFRMWLDDSMTYSAARWSNRGRIASSLEEAQLWKLDWHLSSSGVQPGGRMLDVGCGWGSLLLHGLAKRRIGEAVGVTPSGEQAKWIHSRAEEARIQIIQDTWQNADFETPFDVIFSVEALESFARPNLSSEERRHVYEEFFRYCGRNLSSDGRVSLQFICWMDIEEGTQDAHLPRELFPESALPHAFEVLEASKRWFHLMHFENRPKDYSQTLQEWLRRVNEHRDKLIEMEGKVSVKRFIRGFRRFILGFEGGSLGLVRVSLKKRRDFEG